MTDTPDTTHLRQPVELTNYICAVTGRFPENYSIGLEAGVWSVEEKHEKRIRNVAPGDTLVFALGGEFRSIHRIESRPFQDSRPLWPEKNGSIFPHRVKISDAMYKGRVSIDDLAQ